MDQKLLLNLIKEAQTHLVEQPQNYAHEITHHYRTWLNALEITDFIDDTFDKDVVELVCWWHDVQIGDPVDGKRICEVTAEYISNKVEPELREVMFDSIAKHEFGSKPAFIEGKILQDADKLEILSEERFRIAVAAVRTGLMSKNYFYNASVEIYNNWLPKMPESYNFDISRKIHKERLARLDNKIKNYIEELKNL